MPTDTIFWEAWPVKQQINLVSSKWKKQGTALNPKILLIILKSVATRNYSPDISRRFISMFHVEY